MKIKCIFCDKEIRTNDASYSLIINAEGMEKEQLVSTIFEGDICGLCASYFDKRIINIVRKNWK